MSKRLLGSGEEGVFITRTNFKQNQSQREQPSAKPKLEACSSGDEPEELKALLPIPLLTTIGATSTSAPCIRVKCSVGVIMHYITSLRYDGLGPYVETYFMFCSDGEHMVMDIASMCSPIIYARRRSLLQTHTHTHLYFKFGLPMERHRHHYFCCIEFD